VSPRRRIYIRFLAVFIVLGAVGLTSAAYLLIRERAPLPFQDVYTVKAQFTSADAVVSGLGQPVNVVGVKVGQVIDAKLVDGRAQVTLEIQRKKVPRVYSNATAVLEPITPLNDMQINLDPGSAAAPLLAKGGVLGVGQTAPPVPLSDLLSTLDGDTRSFLTSLIASTGEGLGDRAPDTRKMLRALGPTTQQVGLITRAAAQRRVALARLVHNVAKVTGAAAQDRQLASLVAAGNRTLQAVAAEDVPLRQALEKLPPTLDVAQSTLAHLAPFADKLGPSLSALQPAVKRLPQTFAALRPFADQATATLKHDVRPLIHDAQPLVRKLAPSVGTLTAAAPKLTRSFQIVTYLANELAYNPDPGGKNQGFLFWLAWGLHNFNSVISVGDAHGGIGRAEVIANCYGVQSLSKLQPVLALFGLCPK
jgi:phospholipid/cholesterol/gamma-HCH transport system substrate-binding protein